MAPDETPVQFTPVEPPAGTRGRPVDWSWVLHQWKGARYWGADDVETVLAWLPEGSRFYAPPAGAESRSLTVRFGGRPFLWLSAGSLQWARAVDGPTDADGGYTAADGSRRLRLSRHQQAGERTAKHEPDYGPLCTRCFLHHHGECDF